MDTTTPVRSLAGFTDLATTLALTPPMTDTFADWVEVFRTGLDTSRRAATEMERVSGEHDWWMQAEHTLTSWYGATGAAEVIAWLEARFGRRDGAS